VKMLKVISRASFQRSSTTHFGTRGTTDLNSTPSANHVKPAFPVTNQACEGSLVRYSR
jgi:hypothetical protein